MISFLGTIIATQPATTGHISVSRDIIRDWRRWSRAERAAAVFVTVECPGADNRREAGYSTLRSSLFHARTPSASNRRTFGGSTSHSAEYRQTFEMDRIFIADGPVWTSAGMTAGIDLALGLIERDLGQQAAQRTAKVLVVHHRRAGGQSQHSAMLQLDAKSDRVQIALAFAKQNLREPLTVELLADAARLSPRQFSRVFRAETGLSPAKAIENLRLEAAE